MKKILLFTTVTFFLISFVTCRNEKSDPEIPHLIKKGNATQLVVDGKPYLILGGELHNSSSSSRDYMRKFWPELEASGMNTVLAAVEWSLIEPAEGKFDFSLIDGLLQDARNHNLKLILLWFGSWKNSQSQYIPEWMKNDFAKFPRAKTDFGKSLEIVSPFSKDALEADKKAFSALMNHLKDVDSQYRTVIMMQVENEAGILGSTRDYSPEAESAFHGPVPDSLMRYLAKHKNELLPELAETWRSNGFNRAGSWEEVFGKSAQADEIFMAWQYATYINSIARAGRNQYPLPMYVNAWIVQKNDSKPGDYPSGGPQAHMLDIWRAGSPDIDLYCPDIYRPEFSEICTLYTRSGNTLFVPEAKAGELGAGQFFYAVGRHNSIGYSPFGFEDRTMDNENDPMTKAYKIAGGMAPLILEAQKNGTMTAVILDAGSEQKEEITLGNYKLLAEPEANTQRELPYECYAIIINPDPDEFIIYGKNIQFSFQSLTPGRITGISRTDEGVFENGIWKPGRRLNGDEIYLSIDLAGKARENKTGSGIKFDGTNTLVQWIRLYQYE